MTRFVLDTLTFAEVVKRAALALVNSKQPTRIDIYREVWIDDPVTLDTLGRRHPIAVRVKITARSMLFDNVKEKPPNA